MADENPGKSPLEEANEKGYIGTVPDDTPNEAYTVAGVTSSDEAAKADRKAASKVPVDAEAAGETPAETKATPKRSTST